MIGWAVAEIVSHLVGKRITISDLLPEMFPPKIWTKEEIKKELDDLKHELRNIFLEVEGLLIRATKVVEEYEKQLNKGG